MSQKLPLDSRVFPVLLAIDLDLAAAERARGCACGGALHAAHFRRKPRGAGRVDDPRFELRFSFCCDQGGCRSRATPPSVRFLDRRVYLGVIVVLVSVLRQGPTPWRMAALTREFGVDVRTVQRWQCFWKDEFPSSPRARFLRIRWVGLEGALPAALYERSRSRGDEDPLLVVLRELAECAALATSADRAA